MSNPPTISVVVPVFNEEENLPELIRRTTVALEGTGESWEMVLVDDGSRDGSVGLIRAAHGADARVKLVALSRNFGHQPAITAGVRHARGAAVILMDADLQDPPEVIPAMVAKWRGEKFDVVMARRRSRADARGARGIGFRLFYPLLRRLADLPEAPDAGIFGLMDRKVVAEFNRLPERNRFIPGLRVWLGFKQGEVEYDRADRAAGEPKQTLGRLIKYAIDGMLSFSTRPLRVATWMGFLCAVVGFGIAVFFAVKRLLGYETAPTGFTTLLVMMMFIGGIQLIAVGILGEYLGRVYEEVKQRPLYVVGETLGVEEARGGEER